MGSGSVESQHNIPLASNRSAQMWSFELTRTLRANNGGF